MIVSTHFHPLGWKSNMYFLQVDFEHIWRTWRTAILDILELRETHSWLVSFWLRRKRVMFFHPERMGKSLESLIQYLWNHQDMNLESSDYRVNAFPLHHSGAPATFKCTWIFSFWGPLFSSSSYIFYYNTIMYKYNTLLILVTFFFKDSVV